jgi:predicted RecB family nuclease
MGIRGSNVGSIYSDAMAGKNDRLITSTMIYRYVESPFSLWCDTHAPAGERDPRDAYQEYLFKTGQEHEAATVKKRFPGIKTVTAANDEEAFRLALTGMAEGVKAFHGPALFWKPEGLKSKLDLLERSGKAGSVFGKYHYVVKEVKLARNIRENQVMQTAFNNFILGKIQGYTPPRFFVINRDQEELPFDYDEARLLEVLNGARKILGATAMDPVFGSAMWPWKSYCKKKAIEVRDASLVGGVGPAMRAKLGAAGITTIDQLHAATEGELRSIKGIGPANARSFAKTAEALVKGKHVRLDPISLPHAKVELFVDLEGTSNQVNDGEVVDMDYLIGVLAREGGKEKFHSFVAHSLEGERAMFHEFVKWLSGLDDYLLYHWSPSEKTHFGRMADKYKLKAAQKAAILGKLQDLRKIAITGFAFPTYGTGIKAIAPYIGFAWSQDDVSGTESIAMYFEYVEDPVKNRKNLEKIVKYNREDCEALRVVKDWLEKQAKGKT